MSDPTATKRLTAEARRTCTTLEEAARKLSAWASQSDDGKVVLMTTDRLDELSHALAHQGGRLDMAVSMAHTRAGRKKK